MFCRKCGVEIDISNLREDGAVQCPECGAVYKTRNASSNANIMRREEDDYDNEYESSSPRSDDFRFEEEYQLRREGNGLPQWVWGLMAAAVVAITMVAIVLMHPDLISGIKDKTKPNLAENPAQPEEYDGSATTAIPTDIPTITETPYAATAVPTATPAPTSIPTIEPTATPALTPAPTLAELSDDLEYRVEITGDKVNVRESPDTNSSAIKPGYKGNTFKYIDQTTGADSIIWYSISNNAGQIGWVSSQYSKIIIAAKATPTPITTEAPQDDEEEFDFSAFEDDDNDDGFIDGPDDELVEGFNRWADDRFAGTMIVVNCDSWVSLRSKPSTKASRLAKVPKGEILDAFECDNSKFYECDYDGQTGYILKKYLQLYQ